ncbi:hypothetical protein PV326_001180 [Microctonus aethiopoides]|nr:hypothetical protein PV326_001180 [Microctonus aethiopoides]
MDMKDIKGIGKALFRPDEEKLRYNKEQKGLINKVDGNYNDHKMVLTGKKYAERMLLNNDHKLMTPLFNKPTTPKPMHLIMVNDNNMGDET